MYNVNIFALHFASNTVFAMKGYGRIPNLQTAIRKALFHEIFLAQTGPIPPRSEVLAKEVLGYFIELGDQL